MEIYGLSAQVSGGGYALYINGQQVSVGGFQATADNGAGGYEFVVTSGNGTSYIGTRSASGSVSIRLDINAGITVSGSYAATVIFSPT